ncbi:MAG: sugar phosphate isomerase/epimerase [Oscillospiraceae bacterium]|nr:sugar phosphate isomerase/epimerase [Oscillospiraceae bacterium]
MKLCIRAHDLGVQGTEAILARLAELDIDGVQMVCYKAYDDIPYAPGAITPDKAAAIGQAFAQRGAMIPLVGAYFNPVHSNREKAERCFNIFGEYLTRCRAMGCDYVGSETGSYSDDPWVYHPLNRREEALEAVAQTFSRLCDIAEVHGSTVAMEGAAGHVCWNVQALAKVRKMIGKKTAVIFDLYNYLDETNQRDYLKILDEGLDTFAGEILLFHMKDCRFLEGGAPRQVPLGTGDMDMEAILRRIKAYDENAVLTLEGTTGDHIARAVATIRGIWDRI